MIIRVDDVSANTDMDDLNKSAELLHKELGAEIWYCVNLLSRSGHGAVYPDIPLRGKPLKYFYNVDQWTSKIDKPFHVKLVSHGLLHTEHGSMHDCAQELSILTSCSALHTDIFVPPFMSFDERTEEICKKNGIILIDGKGWKSAESQALDTSHGLWFFHPWRMNYSQIKDWVNASKIHV